MGGYYFPTCSCQDSIPFFLQGIWSDEEGCVEYLKGALDELSQPTNTLERILDRVACLLAYAGLEDGVASGDEGEESEEEEFEDYYNDDQDAQEEQTIKKGYKAGY